ncbi:hypothetical protein DQ04_00431000, partial [Trypanosoma grayi]|uniref:hypothetical protein n=1 Tax=Trypanosoma grayi TaxID=71804 RepID=UPI0004F3F080
MLAIHDWKRDWVTEGHAQRQYFARNSLQRSFRGDSQRRVTSSSAPSSVAVVDCCWARGHRTGGTPSTVVSPLASCLFCALSGGGVCILNTTNFAKTYLFEGDAQQRQGRKDDRGQKKDAPQQHDGRRERLVAIDCQLVARRTVKEEAVPRTAAKGATTGAADESVALVCAVVDGWLCTFAVDADAV